MGILSDREKEEFKKLALSGSLSGSSDEILKSRHVPWMKDGKVDVDKVVEFLDGFNWFINHRPKPFQIIIDNISKI